MLTKIYQYGIVSSIEKVLKLKKQKQKVGVSSILVHHYTQHSTEILISTITISLEFNLSYSD